MRRSCLVLLIVMVLLAGSPAAFAAQARLARQPAPSPDGTRIVFSWQGDLWIVPSAGGTATRLTAHPARDMGAVWSRDGSLIAFASGRFGNADVFVMPVDGSAAPTRLTWGSFGDVPVDFTPDGKRVLLLSNRLETPRFDRGQGVYSVGIAGGTPALVQPALGHWPAYSPDGQTLAFVRGGTRWTRNGYRGAANREIWLHTPADEYVQLTDFDGDDDCPSWIDDQTLVILSARAGRKNLFAIDVATGETRQLTHHEGSDVRFPRASADGKLVAYEFEDGLWTVASSGGEPRRLEITVPADIVDNRIDHRVDRGGADELTVNADATFAAFIVHGDVFVTAIRSKDEQDIVAPPTVRVTDTPGRERDIAFSPDGKSLLMTSDRAGNFDLYLVKPAAEDTEWTEAFEFETTQLTSAPAEEYGGQFSPDGERIAFVRERGDLVTIKTDGSDEKELFSHWGESLFAWSPDGKWIAYTLSDLEYNDELWILPADGGTPYNVSRHPDTDVDPQWSPDGKRLFWLSRRHDDNLDLWGVWLTREDHERTPEQWLKFWKEEKKKKKKPNGDGEEDDDAKKDKKGKKGKKGKKDKDGEEAEEPKPELPEVKIDFDGLWERVGALTDFQGDEGTPRISRDGKRILFTADYGNAEERDLYSLRWDGEDLKRLTEGGQNPQALQLRTDSDTIFYLGSGGTIRRISLDGKSGDPVPFEARHSVDRIAEMEVDFDEAWRVLNLWFYDADFHGVDWRAQYEKYRPWALAASHPNDFATVVNLMLGELNASHMGYFPRNRGNDGRREVTGLIGATFDPAAGGPGILVREVLPDSPAARRDVGIKPGERIVSVNGREVVETTSIFSHFAGTAGQRVPIEVADAAGERRCLTVIPVRGFEIYQLRYREWTRERRKIVEELSGGRLGYLHIQGMDIPSFEEFERDLHAAGYGKEGLLIDVRSNGGGWTTDYLMAVLMVSRHAYTMPRGGDATQKAYPQPRLPLAAWTKPAMTVCNEESYSNAEIFSWAFKTLERGKLVGYPTFGAVISTGGMMTLGGAHVRLPGRGWYVAGSGINMENNGAVPDVVVPLPPVEDTARDRDTQLKRAVEIFLGEIESDPRYGSW